MENFSSLLQSGSGWLFAPSAILLGALHGLEPGHSKTMMAAFIVAVRGTVAQAVLLGLSATVSHTAVVWIIAMAGLYYGRRWDVQTSEPYFQLASAAIILFVAGWMTWRTWREGRLGHLHDHDHDDHHHEHEDDHDHRHDHHHAPPDLATFGVETHDAHEAQHAEQIRRRFANRHVTTSQIVLFGLTGGLIPCPASITVLLLCLQLQQVTLGAVLVACFSIGLALTMVASGTLAALGAQRALVRWPHMQQLTRKAPYISAGVIAVVGVVLGVSAANSLA